MPKPPAISRDRRVRRALLSSAAVAGLVWMAAPPAAAQTAPAAAEPADLGELVVTGSRIRGVAPVGSTLITVGEKELETAPAANVIDLLRRVPQIGGAGINEGLSGVAGPGVTSSNATRTGAINLRGVGPKATLVLFGGERLAYAGLNGAQTDPAAIPVSAIDRVEVVADGASAIYGSDAVAGVVNFVPKTSYDGINLRLRSSRADGYDLNHQSLLMGRRWGAFNALVVLQHDYNSNLNGTERDFYKSDLRPQGGTDYRSSQCNPGTIIVGNVPYAIPAGGVTPATASQLIPNTRNFCEVFRRGDILGKQDRTSGYFNLSYDFTPGFTAYVRGFGARRLYLTNDSQQGSTTSVANLTVPRTNPFFVAPPGTNPASVTVAYDFTRDAGQLRFKGESDYYQLIGGAEIDLPGDWRSSVSGNWARSDDRVNTFFALPAALTAALNSTNPATAFNAFGGENSAFIRNNVFTSFFNSRPRSIVTSLQAEASGPVFELPGGALRLAFGADYSEFSFQGSSNRGLAIGGVRANAGNHRNTKSVFAEVFVPLVGEENAMTGVQRLELSLAGRYDKYSDVGSTTNPKIGVNYQPIESLKFRGTYGTSFKAPYLSDTLSPRSGASLTVNTTPDPLSPSGSSTGLQINDGRPGLVPEEATTYTFGAEWRPPFAPGLKLTATYYSLDYKRQISAPVITNVLINPIFAGSVERNPTPARVQEVIRETGLTVNGVLPARVDFIFDGRPTNLGGTEQAGWDFTLDYDRTTDFGDIYVTANATHVTKYDLKVTPIAPTTDALGTIYFPVKWRGVAEVGWSDDAWSASVTARYYGKYGNNLVTPTQRVNSHLTFDLRGGYEFPDTSRWTRDLMVTLEVSNLFDNDPPFVNIQGGVDPTAASLIGRMFTLTIDKKW